MRVLLSNDDGINAPGILAMHSVLKDATDLTLVAPESEQSAVGHAITLATPLRVRKVIKNGGKLFGYAVNGTPADCVKIAIREIMKDKRPDVVISGINQGQNIATNIIYSGTVSAATEGMILGIPSIAISYGSFTDQNFDVAAKAGLHIAKLVFKYKLPYQTLLNVNVPPLSADKIKGIKVCRMGDSTFVEKFDKRYDLRMQEYYWQGGDMSVSDNDKDADISYLDEGYITVTPIHIDLTKHDFMQDLSSWEFDLDQI